MKLLLDRRKQIVDISNIVLSVNSHMNSIEENSFLTSWKKSIKIH
jgi:hypothetical protein